MSAPSTTFYQFEVDHIIPQASFKNSALVDKDIIQDNLMNLALLPKNENISKSNKKLKNIDDPWLISQIREYEFIPEEMFDEFSDVSNYKKMFEYRKPFFIEAFDSKRTYLLNN